MLRGAALTSLALLLAGTGTAWAQVAGGGLGTRVNGTALGRCSAGVCSVQGGSVAGPNLFHRFSQFDTRSGIQRVDLDSRGRSNVVVGVSHPAGSFFNAPLRLSGAANLFWLSPGGLWLGNGARFQGATSLLLSTAPSLRLGGGEFSAVGGLADRLEAGADAPSLDFEALATGSGPIVLAGGRLTVDRQLLLHSGAGPILTAPGERSVLRAGGSVQLSGGNLQLRGLDIQAGNGSDDRLLLRSGALVGGALGRLELAEATLLGSQVRLEGAGGLALERVEARAEGAAGPGALQLNAGSDGAAAGARLDGVRLAGGEVLVSSNGPLAAVDLVAVAGGGTDAGRLQVEAGPAANGAPSLRLERVNLQGRSVVIRADGAGSVRDGEIRTLPAGAQDRQNDAADLWLGTRPGPGGTAAPLDLENVRLDGRVVVVAAAGDLQGRALQTQARDLWLEAADAGARLRLQQSSLQAEAGVRARSRGDLLGTALTAESPSIQLEAGGTLALEGSQLKAPGASGQILLDALSPPGDPQRGTLALRSTLLSGQTIVGRADRLVSLAEVSAEAGTPGNRGLIRLETAPAEDPPTGPGPGTQGDLFLRASRLQGQWLLLLSGSVTLHDSQLEAPKGLVHLEATTADLELSASQLDVGVHDEADLRRQVEFRFRPSDGVEAVLFAPDPLVTLLAAADLRILGSRVEATQDVEALRGRNPALADSEIALTDTSGSVVAQAGAGLLVEDSSLGANATDNLAGNLFLKAKGQAEGDQLRIHRSSLSASGPLGSGDIRLNSAGGIRIEERSRLQADATARRADPLQPDLPSRDAGFSGGEITLTNGSALRPIAIENSQLLARQGFDNGRPRLNSQARTGTLIADAYDDFDNGDVSTGGAITLLSSGGISVRGDGATLSVSADPQGLDQRESIGGVIRIANTSQAAIVIGAGAQLTASSNQVAGPPQPGAGQPLRGEINLWNRGSIEIGGARLEASTYATARPPGAAPLADGVTPVEQNEAQDESEPHNSLSVFSETGLDLQASTLLYASPDGRNQRSIVTPPAREESGNSEAFSDTFNAVFDDRFWGRQRTDWFGRNYYLDPRGDDGRFFSNDDGIQDQVISGGAFFPEGLVDSARHFPARLSSNPDHPLIRTFFDLQSPPDLGRTSLPAMAPIAIPALPQRPLALATAPLAPPAAPFSSGGATRPPPLAGGLPAVVAFATPQLPPEGQGPTEPVRSLSSAAAVSTLLAEDQQASAAAIAALGLGQVRRHAWQVSSLQEGLQRAANGGDPARLASPRPRSYAPAILQISLSEVAGQSLVQVNQILVPAVGEVRGWQSRIDRGDLQRTIRAFQRQVSLQESLDNDNSGERLASILLAPAMAAIRQAGVNALILSLDRGLQGIPFAALPLAGQPLGDAVALTVTPALALTDLAATPATGQPHVLLAGSSRFHNGLAPLPMARQEIERLASLHPGAQILLDEAFEAQRLLKETVDQPIAILHLATHADFLGSQSGKAVIYTSRGDLSLRDMGSKQQAGATFPIGLFVLNACRTSLGDEQSELGIAGLALQAGARSALGNLWFVDDVVTAAFSIEFHRALQQGLPKDLALQETQRQFRNGDIRVRGDQIINRDHQIILDGLSQSQQIMLDGKLSHPYYWSGIILSGIPW